MGSEHHEDILRITRDVEAKASIDGYIYEALSTRLPLLAIPMLRLLSLGLDPPFEGIYRTAVKGYTARGLKFKEGDRLFLNIAAANLDVSLLSLNNSC